MNFATRTLGIASLCSLFLLVSADVPAQTKSTDSKATQTSKSTKKIKGRLPNNYGKLELTTKQRTEIYEIQAKYRTKIDDLEKQLAELKAEQDKAVEVVLTTTQKKKLEDILTAKKKKE